MHAPKSSSSHSRCAVEKWCCQEAAAELMHGSEVEAGVRRQSWFKLAWREKQSADLSGWALAALYHHIPQKVILNLDFCPHKLVDSAGRKGAPVRVGKFEEKRHIHSWHLLLEFRTVFLYWLNLTHLFIFDFGEISIFYEYLQEKSHHLSWKYWSLTDFSFSL